MISVENKNISYLDLPILISICHKNPFNSSKAASMGFGDMYEFFQGKQENTWSWFGNDGNLTYNETIDGVVEQEIKINSVSSTTPLAKRFLLFDGECKVAEGLPSNILDSNGFLSIDLASGKYEVYVVDAGLTGINIPKYVQTGDKIKIDATAAKPENVSVVELYSIQLRETSIETGDGSCAMYGAESQYKSYADCKAEEYRRIILPVLNCTIPWISGIVIHQK